MWQGVLTHEQLDEVVHAYLEFEEFVFDVETIAPTPEERLDPLRNSVFWISMAGPGRADVIPCGHPLGELVVYPEDDELHRIHPTSGKYQERRINETSGREKWFDIPVPYTDPPKQLWISDVAAALEPLMFSKDHVKIGHGVKYDLRSMAKYYGGHIPPPPYGDTEQAARLVNENYPSFRLGDCINRAFHFKYNKKMGAMVEIYPYSEVYEYSYYDSKWDWLLWQRYGRGMTREEAWDIYEMEMRLLPVIIDMEHTGVAIDEVVLAGLGEEFSMEMAQHLLEINKVWKGMPDLPYAPINLNANAQVAQLIYGDLGHKCKEFTPTGKPKTSKEVLENYAKDPIVERVLDFAALNKLQGSFVEGIQRRVVDGAVHSSFQQTGTVSGRVSSREPNVQQVPSRTERGKRLRDCFVSRPGHLFVVADLSQIELRVLAHFTQDPDLLQAYIDGLDLHAMTSDAVFGDHEPVHRGLSKNGNFSVVFGAHAPTLVKKYGFPNVKVAQNFLDGWFEKYSYVNPWKEQVWETACKRYKKGKVPPYVETILGRRRRLPDLLASRDYIRYRAERQAVSTIISGSAADLFKLAMIQCHEELQERDLGHILMTVHDELVVEVPESYADDGLEVVKRSMEQILNPQTGNPILTVPLVADAKIVSRWSDGK